MTLHIIEREPPLKSGVNFGVYEGCYITNKTFIIVVITWKRKFSMKRDMRLIKKILLDTRDKDPNDTWISISVSGYSKETISQHVKLLGDAGYLEYQDLSSLDGFEYCPKQLTYDGYDYLDIITKPWWKKIATQVKTASDKISWLIIGSVIGAVVTVIITSLFK